MVNPRFVIATALAGLALALAVFGIFEAIPDMQTGTLGHGSLAATHFDGLSASHLPGLIALGSSVAAFIVSWKQKSYLIAGLLIAAGILYAVHLGPFLGDHSFIAIIGPVTGVFFGHVMLALGVVKAIGSAKTPVAKAVS